PAAGMATTLRAVALVLGALGARLAAGLHVRGPVALPDGSLEFTAALRIPEGSGQRALGWKLGPGDDDDGLATISKVRPGGSVARWNKANPRLQVKPGDKIIKVNSIPWHNNTKLFVKHIGKQIRAASKRVKDTPHRLYVKIQRPATKVPETKLEDGSLEFTALLKIPKHSKDSQSKLMGWQLKQDADDTVPATIGKIRKNGAVAKWNQENPSHKIMPGDKIIKVNNIPWHNNTNLFLEHLGHRVKAATKRQQGAEHHLYMKIQRAAAGAEEKEADDQTVTETEDTEEDKENAKGDKEDAKEGTEGDEDSSDGEKDDNDDSAEDTDKDDSNDQEGSDGK
ncbi:unnamed protein product, partial [Prorocentrum cordatum]